MPTRRKSNQALKLSGSKPNLDEETLEPGIPHTPDDLSPAETSIWADTTELLFQAGRLTELDGNAIRAYCRSYVEWQDAYADLQKACPYQTAGTGCYETERLVDAV